MPNLKFKSWMDSKRSSKRTARKKLCLMIKNRYLCMIYFTFGVISVYCNTWSPVQTFKQTSYMNVYIVTDYIYRLCKCQTNIYICTYGQSTFRIPHYARRPYSLVAWTTFDRCWERVKSLPTDDRRSEQQPPLEALLATLVTGRPSVLPPTLPPMLRRAWPLATAPTCRALQWHHDCHLCWWWWCGSPKWRWWTQV